MYRFDNELQEAVLYRDAADVQRYHTKRTLRQQTVGQHSFGVMMLINQIDPDCRKEVLLAAMHHDLPELVTGDIPATAKRLHPSLAIVLEEIEKGLEPLSKQFDLTTQEEALLKWCDLFELCMWCHEEMQLGSTYVMSVLNTGLRWLWERRAPNVIAAQLLWRLSEHAIAAGVEDNFTPLGLENSHVHVW